MVVGAPLVAVYGPLTVVASRYRARALGHEAQQLQLPGSRGFSSCPPWA